MYDIKWLKTEVENSENRKFLFFWGHTKSHNDTVTSACFSQWYESSFQINGVTYKTTEHWMMAQKALLFENHDIYQKIIHSNKPGEAKDLGRTVSGFDEQIWNKHRSRIVMIGNIHKFNQNETLGAYLLNTKTRILVEASPVDSIWGIGLTRESKDAKDVYAWRGLNLLGFALMETRDFLSKHGFFKMTFAFTPPWVQYPEVKSEDEFWRQGKGEDNLIEFAKHYQFLTDQQKEVYQIAFPTPLSWTDFYEINHGAHLRT